MCMKSVSISHDGARELSHDLSTDFPYVAGAHRHQQVTVAQLSPQARNDLRKVRQMLRPLALRGDSLDQIIRTNALALALAVAYKINIRNNRLVGAGEASRKIVQEKPRATVLVRLKDAQQPIGFVTLAKRFQG